MFTRGLRLAWGRRMDGALALGFFVLVASLFPITLGGRLPLQPSAPALLWVAALLAVVLAGQRLLADDAAQGVVEQVLLSVSPAAALGGMLAAHWVATALPLALAAPGIALLYGLTAAQVLPLLLALLLGTPALCVLSALGAALSLGARLGGLLHALVVLPLALPVLLFGIGASLEHPLGGWHAGAFALLAASALAAVAIGPIVVHKALEIASE